MEEIVKLQINPDKVSKEPDLIGDIEVGGEKFRISLWQEIKAVNGDAVKKFTGTLEPPWEVGLDAETAKQRRIKLKPMVPFQPALGLSTDDDPQFAGRLPFYLSREAGEVYSSLYIQDCDDGLNVLFEISDQPKGQGESGKAAAFRDSLLSLAVKRKTATLPF
jgi:hypothetical protein